MVAKSRHLITGIVSLVIIAGLGTPAFADSAVPPDSDTLTITIPILPGSPTPFPFSFPESGEPTGLQTLNLGGFRVTTGSPIGSAVELTEPNGAISDLIIVDNTGRVCPAGGSNVCFASDSEVNNLQTIINQLATLGFIVNAVPETGTVQDVTTQLGVTTTPAVVQVQSDLTEPTNPVGGSIIPVDMTSLFIAGMMTNAFWMVPTLGGIAGTVITLFKAKRKHE